ncbi:MAG: CoA transferase [Candidatus Tectomicrobia bacterium]|nr:CoA transferase [Candidatus Tectomicrobia bacterium]
MKEVTPCPSGRDSRLISLVARWPCCPALLADLGAEVIKIEPHRDDQSGYFPSMLKSARGKTVKEARLSTVIARQDEGKQYSHQYDARARWSNPPNGTCRIRNRRNRHLLHQPGRMSQCAPPPSSQTVRISSPAAQSRSSCIPPLLC